MIDFALQEIRRGTAEIVDEQRIINCLKAFYEQGKTYKVKAGFDPTAPDLHLGHTVLLHKMATFQKFGGIAQFLIGDFTATIGDPSGKSETRKVLDEASIASNAQTYKNQVFKILDPSKTEVMYNSKWHKQLGAAGLISLSTTFTVSRMLERDDFSKRFKAQNSISINEFLYPLLQGYDSVAMDCDIELGGTDQKFNLLMGRHMQRAYDCKKEQSILMMPLLEGLDGVKKMSKSLNNYIALDDGHHNMYGKILSISDELMWRYYELLSFQSTQAIADLKASVEAEKTHPKAAKEALALELVTRFYNKDLSEAAKLEFDNVHKDKQIPSDLPQFQCKNATILYEIFKLAGLVSSSSEFRRKVKENGVKVNGAKIDDFNMQLPLGEHIIQVGKKKFAKIEVTS